MHRAWRRLCLIGAGIVWMTAAGCQEGNQEEPLLEEVEEIREEPEQTEEESLTLFTCAEHGTKRFVVKCEPVGNTDQQDGEKLDRRKGGVYR